MLLSFYDMSCYRNTVEAFQPDSSIYSRPARSSLSLALLPSLPSLPTLASLPFPPNPTSFIALLVCLRLLLGKAQILKIVLEHQITAFPPQEFPTTSVS